MPKSFQSSTLLTSTPPIDDQDVVTPFVFETIHQTVLRLTLPTAVDQPETPAVSEDVLTAVQRLVAIVNKLRCSITERSETETTKAAFNNEDETLETLIPYVSEEAYDVLEALRQQEGAQRDSDTETGRQRGKETQLHGREAANHSKLKTSPLTPHSSPLTPHSSPTLVTIETLIPQLLWCTARSSYRLMRLVEGIQVKCWQPHGWETGMLRLVLLLEAEAPTIRWCFDLATGHPPERLLESIAIVQSDEQALPINHSSCNRTEDEPTDLSSRVDHQLQAVSRLLHSVPDISPFLEGIAVDLLQAGSPWQAGKLQLKLGFEFIAQRPDSTNEVFWHSDLVEATLMEETAVHPATDRVSTIAKVHVALEGLTRSLSPATLIRLIDLSTLEPYTQSVMGQRVAQALSQTQNQPETHDEHEQLASIVKAAIAIADVPQAFIEPSIGLLQPMLLGDEFIPKLLWCLTSSAYEVMQLLGGLPVEMLQPTSCWQRGTLRLLATLRIEADGIDYTLDLSTGRSQTSDTVGLEPSAIVQSSVTALCQQPTQVETLIAYLHQQICETVPECGSFTNRTPIEWLEETAQDWQPGSIQLNLGLAFFPNAR